MTIAEARRSRRLGTARAVAGLIGALPLIVPWLVRRGGTAPARRLEQRFFGRVGRGFGITAEVQGTIAAPAGTLYVANHVSWADILLLGASLDARFVAKDDIAGWPLVGKLAARRGDIFVDRRNRAGAHGQADAIAAALARGEGVVLFPEGTTTDGSRVTPFRSSLFAGARTARRIQPIAIVYAASDGLPLGDEEMARFAWTDDEPLDQNIKAIAARGARATLHFLPAIEVGAGHDRKEAARMSHAAIDDAYRAARRGTAAR